TYPATSEYWTKNNQKVLQKIIDKSMKYSTCILLPIGIMVGVFASDVISFIFGDGFSDAILPLRILIVGTVIQGSTIRAIGSSLAGVGRPDISLKLVLVSATTNIVLNVLLIPHYGIIGAAFTTTCSLLLNTLLGLFFIVKILEVKIDYLWNGKMAGITIIMMVLMYLGWHVFFWKLLIMGGYVLAIYTILLTREDRTYFTELIKDVIFYMR
ncbi:MAG: polysaccharide biosynthesis C-terminal domain-containing protein, partial [Theionarchaea archaeon]|nr:polysaccharide biosynthesis C-terminal domain-containing protein [Theionarchaea archaeon]